MRKVLVLLIFTILGNIHAYAQKYIVYAMNNKIDVVTTKHVRRLKIKDELTPQDVIMIPYNTALELFDKENKKKFIIRTPGKGSVNSFIKDDKNEIIHLSSRLFKFMMSWMTGDVMSHGEGHSDPGTVTREEAVDSTVILVEEHKEF